MRKPVLILCFLLVELLCFGQNTAEMYMENPSLALKDAHTSYSEGNYERTINLLKIYSSLSGQGDGDELLSKAKRCQQLFEKARLLEEQGDVSSAYKYYSDILELNPADANARKALGYGNNGRSGVGGASHLIKVGDKINGNIVCFVDNTGLHGWIMKESIVHGNWHSVIGRQYLAEGWRRACLEEAKLIYQNRSELGLNKAYWTVDKAESFPITYYYTFDFKTGKEKPVDEHNGDFPALYIKNF